MRLDTEKILAGLDARDLTKAPSTNGNAHNGLRITRASDVRIEAVEFLLADRVPTGAVTMLAGDPGLGKSTLSCGLAAGTTVGRHGPAATVLIANAEDSHGHVIVPRLAAAGADLKRVEFFAAIDTTTSAGERLFELPGDVPRLEAHARKVRARLVVIDPLNAHLGDDVSTKSDHSVRRALAPLAAMAQRLKIAVVVVAHLNKAQGSDAIYRVGGSIGLVGGARFHIAPFLRGRSLDAIRPEDVLDLVAVLEAKGLAPKTIRNTIATLSALFNFAKAPRPWMGDDQPMRRAGVAHGARGD